MESSFYMYKYYFCYKENVVFIIFGKISHNTNREDVYVKMRRFQSVFLASIYEIITFIASMQYASASDDIDRLADTTMKKDYTFDALVVGFVLLAFFLLLLYIRRKFKKRYK